jgi:2-C-methyl-D-erythritol 2,4-cyclodiphosphate synthase
MFRIGLGTDTHRLVAGRPFLLGGIQLASEVGELGHSDGDVLAHAIADAVLGASALGDIGELFPPSDACWKDANSIMLLQKVWELVSAQGWKLVNLDCVIQCEQPKILPYRNAIRESIAKIFSCQVEQVFIKGKTAEGLDSAGQGLAVHAQAICLLER